MAGGERIRGTVWEIAIRLHDDMDFLGIQLFERVCVLTQVYIAEKIGMTMYLLRL